MDGFMRVTCFNNLPEDCIFKILSLSSPADVCRAATACSELRLSAASDVVWERFLPPDYKEIVSRAHPSLINLFGVPSKKELFFMLCNSFRIDGGNKLFILDRFNGLKSYVLSARELSISWAGNPMYWSWKYDPESRFAEVVELRMTSWVEIHGTIKLKTLSQNTSYGAYLVFKVSERRAYGLDTMPMEISVQVSNGNDPVWCNRNVVYFRQDDNGQKQQMEWLIYNNRVERLTSRVIHGTEGSTRALPYARDDGWIEIELGHFFSGPNSNGVDGETEVTMSLMETKGHHLKAGLIVEGIEIRPRLISKQAPTEELKNLY